MKQGIDLQALAAELVRQAQSKRDYIVDTRAMEMTPRLHTPIDSETPVTTVALALRHHATNSIGTPTPTDPLYINDITHRQIAERLHIPIKYYRLMLESAPHLLADNVNHWLQGRPQRRMLRTLDGKARAFLSDSYRTLDNLDVAEAVLPAIQAAGAEVESCNVSEENLYIKATLPGRERVLEAPPEALDADGKVIWGRGHHTVRTVKPAIIIGNSEVGLKALTFDPGVKDEGCTNLAIFRSAGMRTIHVGGKASGEGDVWQYLKDETKQLADAAVMRKLADLVEATLTGDLFDHVVTLMSSARQDALPPADAEPIIEEIAKRFTFTEDERKSVLGHLIEGGELNRFGLAQAVTRASQDVPLYDRATDLERVGGQIIELTRDDWKAIAA
jgi:hypothetical protein